MAKKRKITKERERDNSENDLKKEMYEYYKNLNQERENKLKENTKNQKILLVSLFIVIILDILISYGTMKLLNFPTSFVIVMFFIFFLRLFATLQFLITKEEKTFIEYTKLTLEILTIFLVIGQLAILNTQTTISQKQTEILEASSLPNYPKIEVKLNRIGESFGEWELKNQGQIANPNDTTLYLFPKEIGISYRNRGQSNSQFVRFSLWDEYFDYTKHNYGYQDSVTNIDSLKSGQTIFKVNHPNCKEVRNEYDIQQERKKCQDSAIKIGLNKWFLKVDCPLCKERQECYYLFTCIINSDYNEEMCDAENPDWKNDLMPTSCPNIKLKKDHP